MARVINVNLYTMCLWKKLAAKNFGGQDVLDWYDKDWWWILIQFFRKLNFLDCYMSLCQFRGKKTPKPKKIPQSFPSLTPPLKNHPTTQTIQDQNGACIKDKKDFNELWFIRRYGISDSCWEQSKSQEQLTNKIGYKMQIWNALSGSNLHTMKPHIYYFWLLRSISHCVIFWNKASI